MTPTELWLAGALAALGGFTAWLLRWALSHLESDLSYARRGHERGATTAEQAVAIAERKAD